MPSLGDYNVNQNLCYLANLNFIPLVLIVSEENGVIQKDI